MNKIFRKAMTVLSSVALVGTTIGAAAAASYPDPFTSNTAVVYGASAALSDQQAAMDIVANLDSVSSGSTTTLSGGEGVTEDEIVLGGSITATGSKIEATMGDSIISSLLDEKMAWDDGDGSDDYDMHEAIVIGTMDVLTTLNDEDLEGVALSNTIGGLAYRYYFDDAFNCSLIGTDDADDLYLTIMGQEYEVTDMTADTITVTTSEEYALSIGDSAIVDGNTYTVEDMSATAARINGETITEGSSKKIDGLRVEVKENSIFYNENYPEQASLTLKIGEDLSKTYSSGDEYIGEDEDDPLWIWDISTACTAGGYIGVKYNANINDADDNEAGDSIKYVGDSYILPENFGEVKLVGLTDVDYENVKVTFDQVDLYNSTDDGTANEDENVIVISAESTDSITVGSEETDKIYIWFAPNDEGTEADATYGAVEVFYRDHEGDNTPTNKARFEEQTNLGSNQTLNRANIATIEVGDTTVDVDVTIASGLMTLTFENPDDSDIDLAIGGTTISAEGDAGTFERLGLTAEDAEANDIKVNGTDVSTKEGSIMDYYGIIVAEDDADGVEGNANSDEVQLSIPSDQVYAEVSVTIGGEATDGETGALIVDDTESSSMSGKNLIVVGGSAINAVAADLLGSAYRGDAFTAATGVADGEFLIQSFDKAGKTALLVAGYNAADTEKGVTYLLNEDVDTTEGTKYLGTSSTEATIVVA